MRCARLQQLVGPTPSLCAARRPALYGSYPTQNTAASQSCGNTWASSGRSRSVGGLGGGRQRRGDQEREGLSGRGGVGGRGGEGSAGVGRAGECAWPKVCLMTKKTQLGSASYADPARSVQRCRDGTLAKWRAYCACTGNVGNVRLADYCAAKPLGVPQM
jgi:hypothetical protein